MKKIKEIKEDILEALEDKPKGINLIKEAVKLTNKELRVKIEAVQNQIEESSYGRFELYWREVLFQEADRRGLEL